MKSFSSAKRILGIDPGSVKSGWALIETIGKRIQYCDSGQINFDNKTEFLQRIHEIKLKYQQLITMTCPDEIAIESLIFVKSPTALIKLAQTRGIFLSCAIEKYLGKIFEYSPNLVKSSAVGHGHANKEGVQKALELIFGKQNFKDFDESDALAVALCHALHHNGVQKTNSRGQSSLAKAVAHRWEIREKERGI